MSNNNSLQISVFDDKAYRLYKNTSEEKAVLTHYLHNIDNPEGEYYEADALKALDNLIQYSDISEKALGKDEAKKLLLSQVTNVPFPTPNNYSFKFIDLFAGVGGFRLAMQSVGGKCIYSSEINKEAKYTYFNNYGEVPFGDITEQSIKGHIPEKFDILCGGFPCQAFSIAGEQKGFADTRGTLFFDIEQIITKHRPKVVFLENVKNLVSHDKGKTFQVILEILEDKLGYKVFYEILNSMTHANVPQNRERIFIVAFDPEQVERFADFKFPNQIELTNTIHDFLDKEKQEDKYYYPMEHKYFPELEKTMTSSDTVYQWRRVYVRENKSNVCPTLTANMGTGGHNVPLIKDDYGIRKLTPKECFAFQGYPMDNFVLPEIANSKLLYAGRELSYCSTNRKNQSTNIEGVIK